MKTKFSYESAFSFMSKNEFIFKLIQLLDIKLIENFCQTLHEFQIFNQLFLSLKYVYEFFINNS